MLLFYNTSSKNTRNVRVKISNGRQKSEGGMRPKFKDMWSSCQGKSNINYFPRLQNKVWSGKLYIYTKNEFYQGLQTFYFN